MDKLFNRIGEFLETTKGAIFTLVLTTLFSFVILISTAFSTWALSVLAIVLPTFILVRDGVVGRQQEEREKRILKAIEGNQGRMPTRIDNRRVARIESRIESLILLALQGRYNMAKLQESIDALEALVERNDAAVTAALDKIQADLSQLEEQKDDAEEVSAIVERIKGTVERLEGSLSTDPEEEPTPVEPEVTQ